MGTVDERFPHKAENQPLAGGRQPRPTPAPQNPLAGFNAVLTRKQWKDVIDFAHAVDGKIMTSFAYGAFGEHRMAKQRAPAELRVFKPRAVAAARVFQEQRGGQGFIGLTGRAQ